MNMHIICLAHCSAFYIHAFLSNRNTGRIVTVGSVNGSCAYPGISVYCATKFALEGFSDVLRYEMAKFQVKVILIRPGDFARLTEVMARHAQHAKEMWQEMSASNRNLYGNYFTAYHEHILANYGMTSPTGFDASTLMADFWEALLAQSPRYYITVAPVAFRLFFLCLQLLGPTYKDRLISLLLSKVFKFNAQSFFGVNKADCELKST